MFDRFDEDARRFLVEAQGEAHRLGHDFIAPAHLVLAAIADGASLPARALRNRGADLAALRSGVLERIPRRPAVGRGGQLPFTPGAKEMLEGALEVAKELGHGHVGIEHLFLGALDADDGRFLGDHLSRAFRNSGVDPGDAREEVLRLLAEGPGSGGAIPRGS